MSTSQVYDKLPCTISEWKARAKRLKVTTKSPNDLQAVNSGSKVTFREFLTMRIIRPELQSLRDFPHEETSEAVANDIIQADATFMAWLSGVENKDRPDKGLLGIFALVKQGMLMVTARDSVEPPFESARLRPRSSAPVEQPHLPAESSSMDVERATSTSESVVTRVTPAEENLWAPFPRTAAEEEINYFLLNLLNAYTLSLNARVRCEWIAHRNPFLTVSFGQVELSAYVDGYLRHIGGQEAFAILEVKAAKRNHKNAFQVMWQESAEMVAWILRDESKDREYPFSEYVRQMRFKASCAN
ncbi:hypothetical protein N7454_000245 [Penicillium verhagenii]|nr:hypothetical protein N7454_000245 [Penicillium verhagenii]